MEASGGREGREKMQVGWGEEIGDRHGARETSGGGEEELGDRHGARETSGGGGRLGNASWGRDKAGSAAEQAEEQEH